MNHEHLVDRMLRWTRNTLDCAVALAECGTDWRERPDVIGWKRSYGGADSILIEVKVSLSDFEADAKKPHRRNPAEGMGRLRYYACPEGLIPKERLPAGWGLVYVTTGDKVKRIAPPTPFDRSPRVMGVEAKLLCTAIQRLQEGWGLRIFDRSETEGLKTATLAQHYRANLNLIAKRETEIRELREMNRAQVQQIADLVEQLTALGHNPR